MGTAYNSIYATHLRDIDPLARNVVYAENVIRNSV